MAVDTPEKSANKAPCLEAQRLEKIGDQPRPLCSHDLTGDLYCTILSNSIYHLLCQFADIPCAQEARGCRWTLKASSSTVLPHASFGRTLQLVPILCRTTRPSESFMLVALVVVIVENLLIIPSSRDTNNDETEKIDYTVGFSQLTYTGFTNWRQEVQLLQLHLRRWHNHCSRENKVTKGTCTVKFILESPSISFESACHRPA